jgi:hypothetical protein
LMSPIERPRAIAMAMSRLPSKGASGAGALGSG